MDYENIENVDWKVIFEEYGDEARKEIKKEYKEFLLGQGWAEGFVKYYLDTEGDLIKVVESQEGMFFDDQQLFARVDYSINWYNTGYEDEDRQLGEDYHKQVKKELTKDDVINLLSFYSSKVNDVYNTLEEIEDEEGGNHILGLLDRFVSSNLASKHFTSFFKDFKNDWIDYIVTYLITFYECDGEPVPLVP